MHDEMKNFYLLLFVSYLSVISSVVCHSRSPASHLSAVISRTPVCERRHAKLLQFFLAVFKSLCFVL